MSENTVIKDPNQKDTTAENKKKVPFGGSADSFKNGDFLMENGEKTKPETNDTEKEGDFFDPLEDLIPIPEDNNETKDEETSNDNINDFSLSEELEPIDSDLDNNSNNEEIEMPDVEVEKGNQEEKEVSKNLVEDIIKSSGLENTEENKKEDIIPEEKEVKIAAQDNIKEKDVTGFNGEEKKASSKDTIKHIDAPILEEKTEDDTKEELDQENNIDDIVVTEDKEKEPENTDLKTKFYALLNIAKKVYEEKALEKNQSFDLVGMKTENQEIIYTTLLGYNLISFDKKEKNGEKLENHNLTFRIKDKSVGIEVLIDQDKLFSEEKDLIENESKRSQVIEKINKFIFLIEQELKNIEKEKKENEEKEKRKKLKGVFRSF